MTSSTATCPHCGSPRPDGPECPRCGVVFAKAHAVEPPVSSQPAPSRVAATPRAGSGAVGVAGGALAVVALCAAGLAWTRARAHVADLTPPESPRDEVAAQVVEPLRRAEAVAKSANAAAAAYRSAEASEGEPSAAEPASAEEPASETAQAAAPPAPAAVGVPEPRAPVPGGWREGAAGFDDAVSDRKRFGAPMAVYFYTSWCGYCRRMNAALLPAPEVEAYLSGLAKVRMDAEAGPAERALAQRFGVTGYPSFFIVSSDGSSVRRVHPFYRTDGGWGQMSPAEFVAACRKAE